MLRADIPPKFLRALIAARSAKYERLGLPKFECYVLESKEALDSFLNRLSQEAKTPEKHFQLIVYNRERENHYLNIDIQWGETSKAAMLDGAAREESTTLFDSLSQSGLFSQVIRSNPQEGIQHNDYGCSMFALWMAIQLSHYNIYDYIQPAYAAFETVTQIEWQDLPKPFVHVAQSMSFLKTHADYHRYDLERYTAHLAIESEAGKRRNKTIEHRYLGEWHLTRNWLKQASEKTVQYVTANWEKGLSPFGGFNAPDQDKRYRWLGLFKHDKGNRTHGDQISWFLSAYFSRA